MKTKLINKLFLAMFRYIVGAGILCGTVYVGASFQKRLPCRLFIASVTLIMTVLLIDNIVQEPSYIDEFTFLGRYIDISQKYDDDW